MEYTPPLTQSGTTFELDPASELSDLPPLWAIPDLIPCHRLSLIVAPSGAGLTTLACHLATTQAPGTVPGTDHGTDSGTAGVSPACIDSSPDPTASQASSTTLAPADPSQANIVDQAPEPSFPTVLLITDRDAPDVLKPRLQSLGADLSRILILSKVYHHHRSPDGYQPPMDTAEPFAAMDHHELSELLHEHRGIRLVLIDNAELLFNDYNRPARARMQRQLSLLQAVADKREVAIVLLTSIPKLSSDPFRGALLSTFRDTCRLVYLLAPDLTDPSSHLLFNLKNTLTTPIPNLRLVGTTMGTTSGTAGVSPACIPSLLQHHAPGTGHLLGHPTTLTYPHYLHQRRHQATRGPDPDRHNYACEVLIELLSHGPMRVGHQDDPDPNTLYQQTRLAGLAWRTVQRAKEALQIPSIKEAANWTWQLPATIPSQPAPSAALSALSVPSPLLQSRRGDGEGQGGGSSLHNEGPAPSAETWRSSPADQAQLLTPPAPTTQEDISTTPAHLPSNIDVSSHSPSRLSDFAVALPPSEVAA